MDESREEITVDGEPLHQRLAVRAPDLAAGLVARLIDEVPVYASLPPEELRRDITQIAEHGIRMFLGVLRSGRQPDGGELAELRHSAARRAEEGIPLESVVDAYFIGTEQCFEAMMATARPEDVGAVLATHRLVMRHLRQVTAAVAAGYTEEVRASLSEENGARQALLTALLDGEAAAQAAERAGLGLAPSYLVLSMGIGDHPDERAPGVDPTIAARRKLRRLRAELDHEVRGHALATLTPKDGLALLPREVPSHAPVVEDGGRLAGLVGRLSRRCGAELLVGVVAAGPEDIVRAAPLATEIRAVAEAGGRPPGVYQLDDVLLEYQLTRPGPALDRLTGILRPLGDHPTVLGTLRAFIDCGLDRRRTAELLRVHPRTVDYRLRKAATVTGLDPTRGSDVALVHASLAAYTMALAQRES
ncbi:helix-turn-helix domain-containing protein [Streptomyces chumphonensis]|uniref:Helix-turn-helix domain-containing protein n=1 Tax=Streptomyces chumphonensis TaxID=1214925 RepID=A0A927F3F6_9ACTN|nr:PucR family transcriptional regulator [Streptomyces chumphonensis]MBD3934496.1 helix-turn-helix domain-containing protein [Streptomyces chumphonensis]